MNREILFKGKHTHILPQNERIDGTWVCGYLSAKNYINTIDEDEYGGEYTTEMLVDPETVCQYINYTDIRKKKAFEHDIIFCENSGQNGHYGEIVFKDGKYMIDWGESDDLRTDIDFGFTQRRVYVVGNVFDNSDLLKG